MAVTEQTVALGADTVERVQHLLREQQLDGWLLFAFRDANPVASALLGLPPLTRRYVVLIPARGAPTALTHSIEQQPWHGWIGELRRYHHWRELEAGVADMLRGRRVVAMEYSPGGAVPYVDLVPAGALEMVRAAGVEVRSSAELVSAFHSTWSEAGEASHRRAAVVVQQTAHAAFERIGRAVRERRTTTEWEVREWIVGELQRRGLRVGADSIVAANANAANPHYAPGLDRSAPLREGDLVLIDLWGREEGGEAVYADQTWMGYLGATVPDRLRAIWRVLHEAREAGVTLLRERHRAGRSVAGGEVDDAVRAVIERNDHGDHFVHRTGHSIDRELHGSGPNLDNLETRDTRLLIPRVGFSVEPGIYLPGDVGFRSEINVFMAADGPEVTTPEPQRELFPLLA